MALPPELRELAARVSNWGRWGTDDERGTLNLIDAAAVRRGAAAVRRGESFSLAVPFDADGPQTGGIPGRINPQHSMIMWNTAFTGDRADFTTSDDRFEMGVQAATHWDALSHVGYEGLLYNGIPDTVIGEGGAARLGVERFGPIVTRGVLLDVARALGVERVEGHRALGPEELDAALARTGLELEPGDVVLVRTGQMEFLRRGEKDRYRLETPGLGIGSIEWLHARDVAAAATDTLVFEPWPGEQEGAILPVHMINLRDRGFVQGQIWHLDELAEDCAADGVYEFLLCATPLPLTGAVGGVVAPTATK